MIDTTEYYGGTYPEPPEEKEEVKERTIKVKVEFTTYVRIKSTSDDNEIEEELNKLTKYELTEDMEVVDSVDITSWEEVYGK